MLVVLQEELDTTLLFVMIGVFVSLIGMVMFLTWYIWTIYALMLANDHAPEECVWTIEMQDMNATPWVNERLPLMHAVGFL